MVFPSRFPFLAAVFALPLAALAAAANNAADTYFDETKARTLFAFDQVSIPFTQNLKIEMRQPVKHAANPVLPRGPKGTPDSWAVQFYGSVIRDGGKYRLWYVAAGNDPKADTAARSGRWRPAYAESVDGIHWTKPDLGLVEYHGNKHNNLLALDPPGLGILNLKVLHEPGDPDPDRRYKMTAHAWFSKGDKGNRFGTLAVYTSPDGLHWKSVNALQPVKAEVTQKDMLLPWIHYEPSGGLYKWDGVYYASGQNANVAARPYHGRVARTYASGDFDHWLAASTIGFARIPQDKLLGPGRSRDGEQQHEGVSVWNRGNVLLGVYGVWHGAVEWKGVTIDLGFVMSNNGIDFREPAHEWIFLARGKDGAWDQGGVLQGQGFENIGGQTFIYYGSWDPRFSEGGSPPRGGVGVATLPRDRFGDLVVDESGKGDGEYQLPKITSEFVTAAMPAGPGARRFYLNADGLGKEATLKIELLDNELRPLPGYSGADAAVVDQSGFQTPVAWAGRTDLGDLPERVRVRATYQGKSQKNIRFSALYLRDAN